MMKSMISCLKYFIQIFLNRLMIMSYDVVVVFSAKFYSFNFISAKIYPPRGQRRRVEQMFNFIYEIDANDAEIQKFAAQS